MIWKKSDILWIFFCYMPKKFPDETKNFRVAILPSFSGFCSSANLLRFSGGLCNYALFCITLGLCASLAQTTYQSPRTSLQLYWEKYIFICPSHIDLEYGPKLEKSITDDLYWFGHMIMWSLRILNKLGWKRITRKCQTSKMLHYKSHPNRPSCESSLSLSALCFVNLENLCSLLFMLDESSASIKQCWKWSSFLLLPMRQLKLSRSSIEASMQCLTKMGARVAVTP